MYRDRRVAQAVNASLSFPSLPGAAVFYAIRGATAAAIHNRPFKAARPLAACPPKYLNLLNFLPLHCGVDTR
jgi:hypothetical protein